MGVVDPILPDQESRHYHGRFAIQAEQVNGTPPERAIFEVGIVKEDRHDDPLCARVAEREHGRVPEQAVFDACMLRFRPILMTTLTAILGAVRLALGTRLARKCGNRLACRSSAGSWETSS